MSSSAPLYRIVLTGGPCGGKTSALNSLREHFRSRDWRVFLVPEVPTLIDAGGVELGNIPRGGGITRSNTMLGLQLALEDSFLQFARERDHRTVIFFDRGVFDYAAYMPAPAWQALMDERGFSAVALLQRYDAVIHLVTAALGAESAYTLANNPARSETLEQARERDLRTREVWVGHPHLYVIDNSTSFEDKKRRVVEVASHAMGEPAPARFLRKFLVRPAPTLPVHHVEVDIELTCLRTSDGSDSRLRRRGQGGSFTYALTTKSPPTQGGGIRELPLSGREYLAMLSQADPERSPVRKRRRCFLYENLYFEFDNYREPHAGLHLLQVEVDADGELQLPPFMEVEREVTGDPAFTTALLALKER